MEVKIFDELQVFQIVLRKLELILKPPRQLVAIKLDTV